MGKSSKTTTKKKNPHAVALGKLGGGPIGGRAPMAMLSIAERHEFAVSGRAGAIGFDVSARPS